MAEDNSHRKDLAELEAVVEQVLGLKFEIIELPHMARPQSKYLFAIREEVEVPWEQKDKRPVVLLSKIRDGIVAKIKKGTLFTSLMDDHQKEVNAFVATIKELENRIEELEGPKPVAHSIPPERAFILIKEGHHGDFKTVQVRPKEWPPIPKGAEVELVKVWWNFYGTWVKVKHNGQEYDLEPNCFGLQDRDRFKTLMQDKQDGPYYPN